MLKTSIRDLFTGTFRENVTDITQAPDPDIKDHQLYLFSDGELALYAGLSNSILLAVESHVWGKSSHIGRLIWANIPRSYDWQVQFFTAQECVNLYWDWQEQVREKAKEIGLSTNPVERHPLFHLSQTQAKQALIQYHSPCLNLADRPRKRYLTSTYTLPLCELLEGLTSLDHGQAQWVVSYKTFDWATMENRRYEKTIRASSYRDSKDTVIRFLGYEPEELRIVSASQHKPDDMPF